MGSVLKGNRYRLVDNRSFELPLPVKYELLKEDSTIAEYEISDEEQVTCRIVTKHKEEMLTPIQRPLDISDIYYFFSCRVFQDRTPFTLTELSLLGLERYNVYDIIRKTRGVTPFDTYWLRFDGDNCDYETAKTAWNNLMYHAGAPLNEPAPKSAEPAAPESDADVNEILHQHKLDIAAKFAEEAQTSDTAKPAISEPEPVSNNTMSADEIEALLLKSGLTDLAADNEPPAPVEEKSGGKMSQEDIEKMLAAANTSVPEPAAEEKPGGKMSQEDIEKMLAAASAPDTPVPEPAAEEKPGGKMSQEDIEKMLAAASGAVENAVSEPVQPTLDEPAAEEKPGGKMSQADIEALLNGMKEDAST